MELKIEFNDNIVTIFLPDRLTSDNATQIKESIDSSLQGKSFNEVIFDLDNTTYISSAGLRVILSVKKAYKEVTLINVSLEVYDILDLTGFTSIIPVKRQIRKVSMDDLVEIANGSTAAVYKDKNDNIVKVFFKGFNLPAIEREIEISKQAFIKGIATAIPFEMVKVGEYYGTVYEMLNADTLSKTIHAASEEQKAQYGSKLGKFVKEMHEVEMDPSIFPSAKKRYLGYVEFLKPAVGEQVASMLFDLVSSVPDCLNFSHGDFHPGNVMIQNDELLLIDMGEASCGHEIFDIMAVGCLAIFANVIPDAMSLQLVSMTTNEVKLSWKEYLKAYFEGHSEEELQAIEQFCLLYSSIRALMICYKVPTIPDNLKQYIIMYLTKAYSAWDHKFIL